MTDEEENRPEGWEPAVERPKMLICAVCGKKFCRPTSEWAYKTVTIFGTVENWLCSYPCLLEQKRRIDTENSKKKNERMHVAAGNRGRHPKKTEEHDRIARYAYDHLDLTTEEIAQAIGKKRSYVTWCCENYAERHGVKNPRTVRAMRGLSQKRKEAKNNG